MGKKYIADFETTTKAPARVWLWGIMDIDDPETWYKGEDLESFFQCAKALHNPIIYFHNLKFDGNFLIYWLLHHGFTWAESADEAHENQFTTMISGEGQFYTIDVYYFRYGSKIRKISFRDSYKLITISVENMAKKFKLPIQKLNIDYAAHNNGEPATPDEVQYLKHDLLIPATVLKRMFDIGLNRLTIGGCALNDFRDNMGIKRFFEYFPQLDIDTDSAIRCAYRGGYAYAHPANRGKVLRNITGIDRNGAYYYIMRDYPMPFGEPVHFAGRYEYDAIMPLYVQTLRCQFELKPMYLPTIQLKNNRFFIESEYLTDSRSTKTGTLEIVTLTLASPDLELFLQHYNVYNLEYLGGYKFKSSTKLFAPWIDKWNNIKEQSTLEGDDGMREIAKSMLVNLYGKFGTNPLINSIYPILNERTDVVNYELQEFVKTDEAGNVLTNDKGEPLTSILKQRDPVYIPVAVFTTAWGRYVTINNAQKIHMESIVLSQYKYTRFVYANTDSLYIAGDEIPDWIELDPAKLGAYKVEARCTRAKFLQAKKYLLECIDFMPDDLEKKDPLLKEDGTPSTHLKVVCSGMPARIHGQVNFDNFKVGTIYKGKMESLTVTGGVILREKPYKLK